MGSTDPIQRPRRARELGIAPGELAPGELNAITDVDGVRVGHATVIEGDDIRTGVTAIVPTALAPAALSPTAIGPARRSLPAAVSVGNGYGKLIGATQIAEVGAIETPILLTSTLSAFRVADALVGVLLESPGNEKLTTVNPVVGETNDGHLSDIRRRPITEEQVRQALRDASDGRPDEGCIGAGTGTMALGYKAGIGTASRRADVGGTSGRLGALVQSNFAGRLTVLGVDASPSVLLAGPADDAEPPGNSCMIVVATDAAVDARQLGRIARRAIFGLARVGSHFTPGSGDYAIAFSTAPPDPTVADDGDLRQLFLAAMEAVEEAVLNSLLMATTTVGHRGRRAEALPHDLLRRRLIDAGAIAE
jgi:D-aminopeptidase